MLMFNPMLKHRDIMNEVSLPASKTGSLILKKFAISLLPNVLASQNNHFHEERLFKRSSGLSNRRLQILPLGPINLKIIPNSLTKIALKKQMHSILISTGGAKHTVEIICHLPVSSFQQVPSIQPVIKQQPSKKNCSQNEIGRAHV